MEESAAANDVEQFVGMTLEARLVDGADVGGVHRGLIGRSAGFGKTEGAVGIDGGERGEVVLSGDERGGLLHGGFVEWIGMVGDVAGEKWRNDIAAPDAVVIALGAGRVAGMEAFGHFLDGEDADGGGETVIEHDAEVGGGNGAGGLKGRDLGERVDSGVGASGALGQKLLSGEALDGGGQGALDGRLAGLDLPAVEGRAVIGESEFESAEGHRFQGFKVSQVSFASCRGGIRAKLVSYTRWLEP